MCVCMYERLYVCLIVFVKDLYPLAYDDRGTSVAHRISKLCRNILESRVSTCYDIIFWSVR